MPTQALQMNNGNKILASFIDFETNIYSSQYVLTDRWVDNRRKENDINKSKQ